jgi:hypothetical protein
MISVDLFPTNEKTTIAITIKYPMTFPYPNPAIRPRVEEADFRLGLEVLTGLYRAGETYGSENIRTRDL